MAQKKEAEKILDLFYDKVSPEEMMYAKVEASITSQIIKQRIKRSMTQKQFAKMLGCSQAYISKLEGAEGNYTVKKLCEMAVKLDMDLEIAFKPNTERVTRDIIEKVKSQERQLGTWNVFRSERTRDYNKNINHIRKKEMHNV